MLTFLHLSDIHFSVFEGEAHHDVEQQVREAMLGDIETMSGRVGAAMDAVLVVGDLASRGKQEEYELASSFLDRTCELVGCEPERVLCVPGNHDVDRDEHDRVHAAVRGRLRALPSAQLSDELRGLLNEPRGADLLLSPLATYSQFALRYGCELADDRPTWRRRFTLEGREVLVHGLTSAWVCDATDTDVSDDRKVVLGAFQCSQVCADREAISVALVHHPANWLRDANQTSPWLARAHVLLTGHEHAAGITPDALQRTLAVASGAVNPDRNSSHEWIPAYNVIGLRLGGRDETELMVEIYVRSWQTDRAEFGPDPLFGEGPSQQVVRLRGPEDSEDVEVDAMDYVEPPIAEPIASDLRTMIFQIMRAAPDIRRQAANDLGLIENPEIRGLDLDRHILERAAASGRVSDLVQRING
jgi:predicted phosphodiesterase